VFYLMIDEGGMISLRRAHMLEHAHADSEHFT
jgi:hypothetical protein